MNKVTTTSTCGRCRAQEVRSGAHNSDPPDGWATVSLVKQLGKLSAVFDFMDRRAPLFDDTICPPCQNAVLAVLYDHFHGIGCICPQGEPCLSTCPAPDCVQAEASDVD